MQIEIKTLDRRQRRHAPSCRTRSSPPSRAPTSWRAWCTGSWRSAAAGTHKAKGMGEVQGTTKKPYRQKGTGNARQGSLRAPQFRTGGVVHGPVVRTHAYSLHKKVRRLGLISALSQKQAEGKLVVLDAAAGEGSRRPRNWRARLKALGWRFGADRRPRGGRGLPARQPQHPRHRRAADDRRQRLRHPDPRRAGDHRRRRRRPEGAAGMSDDAVKSEAARRPRRPQLSREAMYQIIRSPVITEKATRLAEHGPDRVPRGDGCHQAGDQGGGRGAVRRQGAGGEHARAEGQDQAVQGPARACART